MDISVIQQSGLSSSAQPSAGRVPADAQRVDSSRVNDSRAQEKNAAAAKEPTRQDVEKAVSSMQDFVQSARHNVNFSLEENSGRIVVKVTDTESGATIRQMPSEEALRLAESLDEARSLLFKTQV